MKRAKLPTAEELHQHVQEIAAAFGITLVEDEMLQPHDAVSAHMNEKHAIFVQPVTDEARYAVAMHELGHCLAPIGTMHDDEDRKRLKVVMERAAWEWAEVYALDWTPTMEHVKELCLVSYTQREAREKAAAVRDARQDAQQIAKLQTFWKKIKL